MLCFSLCLTVEKCAKLVKVFLTSNNFEKFEETRPVADSVGRAKMRYANKYNQVYEYSHSRFTKR